MKAFIDFENIYVHSLRNNLFSENDLTVDVLRLDKIHNVVSGNKWFKLKYYIKEAVENGFTTISTYGGAYSNHIVAVAYACKAYGLKSIGIIRGEFHQEFSNTLSYAKELGMEINFMSREDYRNKKNNLPLNSDIYFIPEGGYGNLGVKGAKEILPLVNNIDEYSYVVCAVGTGTMLAGITKATLPHQKCIGISVMKNNLSLNNEVLSQLDIHQENQFTILHDFHFGGYAKKTAELIHLMNLAWENENLPLDFVYTGKTYFAIEKLCADNYFKKGSKILMIHSGGLQGNRTLPQGTLCF